MPASNIAQIGIALQSAKGQVVTSPQYWMDVTAADLRPAITSARREETGQGVDVGGSYVQVMAVSGGFTVNLRPSYAPLIYYGILGTKAVSGSGPFTHTETAANTKPYFTLFRTIGGQLHEVFRDCHFTGVNTSWTPGGDVTAAVSVLGLSFARSATAFTGGVYAAGERPFRTPGRVLTVDAVEQENITEGNLDITWASTAIQTSEIYNTYLEPGAREITGSWTEVWESVARYAEVIYGAAAGTTPSETQYETDFEFVFPHETTGHELTLTVPNFRFTEATATPSTGSDPLMVPIAGTVERPSSGSIVTVAVANAVATYPAAA
jgi:hypothetical protein